MNLTSHILPTVFLLLAALAARSAVAEEKAKTPQTVSIHTVDNKLLRGAFLGYKDGYVVLASETDGRLAVSPRHIKALFTDKAEAQSHNANPLPFLRTLAQAAETTYLTETPPADATKEALFFHHCLDESNWLAKLYASLDRENPGKRITALHLDLPVLAKDGRALLEPDTYRRLLLGLALRQATLSILRRGALSNNEELRQNARKQLTDFLRLYKTMEKHLERESLTPAERQTAKDRLQMTKERAKQLLGAPNGGKRPAARRQP